MSDRTQHNFNVAMADGTVMIRNGSVFFLGPGGSGKTHTFAALLEEEPPSRRESTPCVTKPVRTIAQFKIGVSGVHFKRIEDGEYSDMLSTTAKQFEVLTPSTKVTTPPLATSNAQEMTAQEKDSSNSLVSSVATQVSNTEKQLGTKRRKLNTPSHCSGLEIELLHRMQAVPKSSQHLNEKDLLDMRDSGGQPSFHEVLPIFVKNTTFGVLTVKLNESLDAHPVVEYYSNGKAVGEPFNSPFTHLQTIHHCMRVLQSTCDHRSCPKVVFVGTHKDLERECNPKESREQKNRKLRNIIPPVMKKSIIYRNESLKELLFAVNVKTPGNEDWQIVGDVRDMMIAELLKVPKHELPLRYFALENAFLRLSKYQHKTVLSKEECFKEATAFHFTKESFEAALKYLHGLKLIFHYEEVLPDLVFLNAQTLLDKISELVEYSLTLKSHAITVTGDLEEFKAYGIVTLDLLSRFQSHYVPNVFTEKELILILKYLRILAEVGEDKYLIPCLLKVGDLYHVSPHVAVHNIPALLLYFGPDGSKLGVYCCLITTLITEAKWELMTAGGRPVKVSRNQVQFKLPGDDPGVITITDSFSTFFHISIDFPEDMEVANIYRICESSCSTIRETLLTSIRKALLKLNYDDSIPKVAFPCSRHQATDLHAATISNSGFLTCTTHPASVYCEPTKEHQLWLGKMGTGKEFNLSHSTLIIIDINGRFLLSK